MVVEDVMRGVLTAGNESSRELKQFGTTFNRFKTLDALDGACTASRVSEIYRGIDDLRTELGILFALFTAEPPEGMTAQRLYI